MYRFGLWLSLLLIGPLGYGIRFSPLIGPEWLRDSLGAIAYEIFWILLVLVLWPRVQPYWAAIGVCLATCALEFLQLWQPDWLQAIRATWPGRLVLGNTFTWTDFLAYFGGSFVGWLWGRSLKNRLG